MEATKKPLFSIFQNQLIEMDDAKCTCVHSISSNEKNAYGQILPVTGYDDTRFRKSPMVLLNHGMDIWRRPSNPKDELKYNLGINQKLFVNGDFLNAITEFNPKNDVAMDSYNWLKAGYINSWSKYFFPISKPVIDMENDTVTYNQWGIYEYSLVPIGVDSGAVGNETNMLHALDMTKSSIMKNYLNNGFFNNEIKKEVKDFTKDIQELKLEIDDLTKKTIDKKKINELINDKILNYNKLIIPKITEIASKYNSLLDGKHDLSAIVEKEVLNVIKKLQGKIN